MTDAHASDPPLFPVGPFAVEAAPDDRLRATWIDGIAAAPARLRAAVAAVPGGALDATYRNWTVRQIVHHLADSHLNSYVRFKLALTEERPTIKPYDESAWSNLPDARRADVELSLRLLDALHGRWIYVLRAAAPEAFDRSFYHPGSDEVMPLWRAMAYYDWHARHHTAQITWVAAHTPPGRGR